MKMGRGTPLASGILDTPLPPAGLFVVPDPTPLVMHKWGEVGGLHKRRTLPLVHAGAHEVLKKMSGRDQHLPAAMGFWIPCRAG
jgi:hypothetical protein